MMISSRKFVTGLALASSLLFPTAGRAQDKPPAPVTSQCKVDSEEGSVADKFARSLESGDACMAENFMQTAKRYLQDNTKHPVSGAMYQRALEMHQTRLGKDGAAEMSKLHERVAGEYEARDAKFYVNNVLYHTNKAFEFTKQLPETKEKQEKLLSLAEKILGLYKDRNTTGQPYYYTHEMVQWQQSIIDIKTVQYGSKFAPELIPAYRKLASIYLNDKPDPKVLLTSRDSEYGMNVLKKLEELYTRILQIRQVELSPEILKSYPEGKLDDRDATQIPVLLKHAELVDDFVKLAGIHETRGEFQATRQESAAGKKELARAEDLYEFVLDIVEASPKIPVDRRATAYNDVRRIYEKQNKQAEIQMLFKRLIEKSKSPTGEMQ